MVLLFLFRCSAMYTIILTFSAKSVYWRCSKTSSFRRETARLFWHRGKSDVKTAEDGLWIPGLIPFLPETISAG